MMPLIMLAASRSSDRRFIDGPHGRFERETPDGLSLEEDDEHGTVAPVGIGSLCWLFLG